MKDITITGRRIKIEIGCLIGAFVIANLCNAYAIWSYGASFKEMFTSFFYVLVFALVLYAVSVVLRLLAYGIYMLFKSAKQKRK